MIVTLSTGEQVHLLERYTRKSQKAYNLALAVTYHEGEDGKMELAKDIPVENFNLASEAALLCMIEKVVQGASEQPASAAWMDQLVTDDFDKLALALNDLKRGGKDKKKS